MSAYTASAHDLGQRFGATKALDGVDVRFEAGAITGLLGRNGSGKTTLLSLVAGLRRPTQGSVRVEGRDPFEDAELLAGTCLVQEGGDFADLTVPDALHLASSLRPNWSADLAEHLLERFAVPRRGKVQVLSRGQRSAFGAAVGLASRAPLTIFDEVYLGMDAPTRYAFYDELLADYAAHPRTIVLSSHLIEEAERLFEHVVILEGGKVLLAEPADALRERALRVVGPGEAVERFASAYEVVAWQHLGRTSAATLFGDVGAEARRQAQAAGLGTERVSIQDLFVHLTRTAPSAGGVEAGTRTKELA